MERLDLQARAGSKALILLRDLDPDAFNHIAALMALRGNRVLAVPELIVTVK